MLNKKNNEIPTFKHMELQLNKSLEKDKKIIQKIKKNFKKSTILERNFWEI